MAMTYTTLVADRITVGSIKNWVNNPNVPSDDVLIDAQNEIYTRLRTREMRAVATVVLADESETAKLPIDFMDPVEMFDRNKIPVILRDWSELEDMRMVDATYVLTEGYPTDYSIYDEFFQFNCSANGEQTFRLLYFKKPEVLSGSNETNFLTDRYSPLLRWATSKHAAIFLKNKADEDRYEGRMMEYLHQVGVNDDLSKFGAIFGDR